MTPAPTHATSVAVANYRGFDVVTVAHRARCATCGWRGNEHRDAESARRDALRHGGWK